MSEPQVVVINTASFPYPKGEQFIETEISFWERREGVEVSILPSTSIGTPRMVPEGINVNPAAPLSLATKSFFALQALIHPVFRAELRCLLGRGKLNAARCFLALKSAALVLRERADILRRIEGHRHIDLAYSYWNNETAYALCLLKREGRIGRVISRAHGYDLYEERRQAGYMPVKRQFVDDFDCVHGISDDACVYLAYTYRFSPNKLKVSRLGVTIPDEPTRASEDGVVRMVSVSFCVPVKRIHKIVEGIFHACSSDPTLIIEWVHVGDGILKEALEAKAAEMLGTLPNAIFKFVGALSNKDVLKFLSDNSIDIFINSSASEGIPVSIMEAMAHGIPAIAPDVGGIAELVNEKTGVLLSEQMQPASVHAAIRSLTGVQANDFRRGARELVQARYSAPKNYDLFVSEAINLTLDSDA